MNQQRFPSSAALLLSLPIRVYRAFSCLWPPSCRYSPTCSEYALLALRQHGALRGGLLTLRRLLRCHPLQALGGGQGYDPPPAPDPGRRDTFADG